MKFTLRLCAGCVAVALASGALRAQEADEGEGTQPRPTLPPIEVRPEPETAPPSDVEPGEPFPDTGAGTGDDFQSPFDLPGSYPSLSDQTFGGFSGSMRGLDKSLFDSPNAATIIDRELMREKQARDIFSALQFETGVLVQQTGRGQASPFIRGLTGQQILVLVDGVRVNTSVLRSGPNQYTNLFDPGSIERIEVLRGSQSVMWGSDALGGVINIVTRSADPFSANYTGGNFIQYYGSADDSSYSRASLEGWVGNSGVFGGGSFLNVRDLDRGGGLGPQPFTNYEQYAADIKYNYLINEDEMLTFVFQHFVQEDVPRSDRFQPFVSQKNPAANERPTFFDPQQRNLAYLRWQGLGYNPFFDTFNHTVSWQRNREGSSELSGTQLTLSEFDVYTWGYTMTLSKDFEELGIVSYGGDYYHDTIDAVRFRRATPADPFVPVASPQYPDDSLYDRVGVYANWDLQVTERLNVIAGGRYENVNASGTPIVTLDGVPNTPFPFERTYQDWIGSIGFVYELDPMLNLVGGVYEGFRSPTIDDLTADKTFLQNAVNEPTVGSLNVQPEHSLTYEVGLKLDAPRLRGQVMQWYMNIDDYITRTPDVNNVIVLGNSDARLHGTELAGEFLIDPQWSLYGNFWYTWGTDVVSAEPYPRIPPTQGVLGLRWRDEERRTYADLFTWMVADFDLDRYTPGNLTDARFPAGGQPGYATLNLRLGHTFGEFENHRVSLSLENITDKYYRVVGSGVDGAGFNAILGYEFLQ